MFHSGVFFWVPDMARAPACPQWAGRGMQAASPRNMLKDDVLHDAPTYEGGHASGARAPDTVAGVPTGQEAMEAGS